MKTKTAEEILDGYESVSVMTDYDFSEDHYHKGCVLQAMEEYASQPSQKEFPNVTDAGIRKLLDKIVLKVMNEEVYLYPTISSLEVNKILSEYASQSTPAPVMSVEQVEDDYILRTIDTDKWYWCKCESCGWEDSSEFTNGGHPIADTGDHSDPCCPVCGCTKLEGKPVCDVESYSGVIKVKIPYDVYMKPYTKAVETLSDIEVDKMFTAPTVKAEGWVSVEDKLPEVLETVWVSNGKGWTALGCRTDYYENDEGGFDWCWAGSNGIIYEESGKIVSECEEDDLDVRFWHPLPEPPATK